ncbi:aminodeoxychorismate lyase [Treponema primitia ZAS-2]|uniref:Endolytic murein transglycosylase n=1 Tax=Treponema primitia (strain ATCC BAA-887 / DSM 12427 / ZAS-2) TaxID=545694 RepID=F5YHY7_TREPZ|nr:endolytic transglycosylase MltG [Treponema primitia]AEF86911.1 aminodeoxychorismate lyase [Treponema primitia ZAS-2]
MVAKKKEGKGRGSRSFITVICTLLGTAIVLVAIIAGVFIYLNAPPGVPPKITGDDPALRLDENGALRLELRPGESVRSVGQRLEQTGIIKNRYFWEILSRLDKEYLKAGIYILSLPASQIEIRSLLVSGKQLLIRVTIPEGVTLIKTAQILAEAGICREEEFLAAASDTATLESYRIPGATMEGYLYPDTYLFPEGYPADQVVKTMADTFFKRLAEIQNDAPALSPTELNKLVILASIVEREYRVDEEAPLMAGVFDNRLRIGMALQSCATVEYVITEIQGRPHPERLFDRDIEIRDPYNTYIHPGLPPGPISAPGAVALDAAFHPQASSYLYFRLVNPDEGRHYFSETLDDHIRAGVLYVKARKR